MSRLLVVNTVFSVVIPLVAGYFLHDGLAHLKKRAEREVQDTVESALDEKEKEVKKREEDLKKKEVTVEAALDEKEKEVKKREEDLKKKEEELAERSTNLDGREESLTKKEKELEERETAAEQPKPEEEEPEAAEEAEAEDGEPLAEKRKKWIMDELKDLIKKAEEEELEEDIEPESVEALEKAAMIVAYRKKFYDVFKDKFIYFPTVAKTIVSYSLFEEAEKHYFDEEDEFPMEYSVALRSYVTSSMIDQDEEEDADEEYMEKLAQDIEI